MENFNEDTKFYEIKVESLNEMTRFDVIPNSKNLEIHIEGKEGKIPSIHICKNNGKNVLCHISLIDNQYLRDNWEIPGKMYILNSSEREALDNFLKSTEKGNIVDNWSLCFMQWNIFNPNNSRNILAYKNPGYLTIKEDPKKR